MKKILVTLACALFASFAFAGEYPDISISELEAAIKKGEVIVLDVNGSATYEKVTSPVRSTSVPRRTKSPPFSVTTRTSSSLPIVAAPLARPTKQEPRPLKLPDSKTSSTSPQVSPAGFKPAKKPRNRRAD